MRSCTQNAIVLLVLAALQFLLVGCTGAKQGITLPMGAATIDELIERYRRAHENKDVNDLRGILAWEPRLPGHRLVLEKPMRELFEMALGKVQYVPGPKLPFQRGGHARYLCPNGTESNMLGPICGKILLVEKATDGREARIFDPSYIVIRAHNLDGRYYIDILQDVAEDAARAYKTNTPQNVVPKGIEVLKPL